MGQLKNMSRMTIEDYSNVLDQWKFRVEMNHDVDDRHEIKQ